MTIADNVIALQTTIATLETQVTELTAVVQGMATPTVNLQPVLDAVSGVAAQLQPTPAS